MKNYYENILANHNYVAKPNVARVTDITSFELSEGKIIYVFFCLDSFSNRIIVSIFERNHLFGINLSFYYCKIKILKCGLYRHCKIFFLLALELLYLIDLYMFLHR